MRQSGREWPVLGQDVLSGCWLRDGFNSALIDHRTRAATITDRFRKATSPGNANGIGASYVAARPRRWYVGTMKEVLLFLLVLPVQLMVFLGLPYLIWRRLARGRPATTALPIVDDGAGGRSVPVKATFTGVRGLPWIGLAHNSLNPRLTITSEGLAFRVLLRGTRRFDEIEQVDICSFGATVLLSFSFRGSPFTLDANVGSLPLAASVCALLPPEIVRSERASTLAGT